MVPSPRLRHSLRGAAPALALASLAYSAGASSVEPSRISLPKGPASVEGLGRNFVPSLASGTAAYGLEIALPPGVAGFVPKLALEYDSGGAVSELGMGWRLGGVPSIRRRTENGLPRFDETDTFEVTGLGVPCDLLEVAPGVFRPEFEDGTFVRVKRSDDGDTWEARVKNGFSYRFGGEGYTESEDRRAATYLLRSQHDLHGHTIDYGWDTAGGYALLRSVTYNGFSDESRVKIAFTYQDRPDTHVLFSSGIRRELEQRLETVEITLGGSLVRRYELAYRDLDGHSRLSSIRMVGTDGEAAMPTLSFGYTEPTFAAEGQLTRMRSAPGRSPAEPNTALTDFDGDSLPDLLVGEAGAFRSYTNHDGVSWQPGKDWGSSASPSVSLGTTGVQLADVDGDGAVDLLAKSGTSSFRYFTGAARFGGAVVVPTVPNITFEDPDVRLADMDGTAGPTWWSRPRQGSPSATTSRARTSRSRRRWAVSMQHKSSASAMGGASSVT